MSSRIRLIPAPYVRSVPLFTLFFQDRISSACVSEKRPCSPLSLIPDERLQAAIAYGRVTVLLSHGGESHSAANRLRNRISFDYRLPIFTYR